MHARNEARGRTDSLSGLSADTVRGHPLAFIGENSRSKRVFTGFLQLARRLLCYAGKNRNNHLFAETHMNTLTSKLTAFAAAVVLNSLLMGAVGFLFALQSHSMFS